MVELREFLSFSINFYSTIEFRLIDQILQAKNIQTSFPLIKRYESEEA